MVRPRSDAIWPQTGLKCDTCHNVDVLTATPAKSDVRGHVLRDSIYTKHPQQADAERASTAAPARAGGGAAGATAPGSRASLCSGDDVLELDGGDGGTEVHT